VIEATLLAAEIPAEDTATFLRLPRGPRNCTRFGGPVFLVEPLLTELVFSQKNANRSAKVSVASEKDIRVDMAPVTLPPSFFHSFWSADYRSGLEVLFRNLEQVGDFTAGF